MQWTSYTGTMTGTTETHDKLCTLIQSKEKPGLNYVQKWDNYNYFYSKNELKSVIKGVGVDAQEDCSSSQVGGWVISAVRAWAQFNKAENPNIGIRLEWVVQWQ